MCGRDLRYGIRSIKKVSGVRFQEFGSWNAARDELGRVECGKKEKAQGLCMRSNLILFVLVLVLVLVLEIRIL